jgi:NADPH:quinone reductase-like Zn-dependent oxidoreductase
LLLDNAPSSRRGIGVEQDFSVAGVRRFYPGSHPKKVEVQGGMSGSSETEFAGKRALVTGGTKGIGEAIVQRLRRSGATVVTTARSAPTDLREPDLFVGADISTTEGVEKVVGYVRDRLGGVDILVNNVGGFFGAERRLRRTH